MLRNIISAPAVWKTAGAQIDSGIYICVLRGTLAKRDYLTCAMSRERGAITNSLARKGIPPPMYMSREKVWLAYIQSSTKRGVTTKSKRRILRYASIFVAFAHRFQSVIPKSSHSRVDLHFSTEFLSFLLVESLTFDKKVSFPLADRFSLFWPR